MSTRNTYPAEIRRKVDRGLARNTSPAALARKLGLPPRYIYSRKQLLRNRAAMAALKAQEQAAAIGAVSSE